MRLNFTFCPSFPLVMASAQTTIRRVAGPQPLGHDEGGAPFGFGLSKGAGVDFAFFSLIRLGSSETFRFS